MVPQPQQRLHQMGTVCGVRKADPGRLGRQHQGARQGQFAAAERKLVALQRLETTGRLAEDPGNCQSASIAAVSFGMVERESARFEIRQGMSTRLCCSLITCP